MAINDKGNIIEQPLDRSVRSDNEVADMVQPFDFATKASQGVPQPGPRLTPPMGNGAPNTVGSRRGTYTGGGYPPRRIRRAPSDDYTVTREPPDAGLSPLGDFTFTYASFADEIPPWGNQVAARDRELRRFWPTEPVLASAIFSTCSKYASMEWELDGPARTVGIYQKMLQSVQYGAGWNMLWMRDLNDLFTQDNGSHIEIVRMADDVNSPVISMNHLDANRCIRTGWRDQPIIYYDTHNNGHLLKWYQVISLEEFPSPIEAMRGIQYCAVTRMLRAAQILHDVSVYKREKLSGRFNKSVWLVSGIQQAHIEHIMSQQRQIADAEGITRYLQPLIIGSLDPSANVKAERIDLASLPDGYDENETMRWYVNQLALAFGGDYQDFSPLPGGNLGTSQQSQTLHLKSRSKGSMLFTSIVKQKFNYWGILPPSTYLTFTESDLAQAAAKAELGVTRAKSRAQRIMSGEIDVQVARQMAVQDGDLSEAMLLYLNKKPLDTSVIVGSDVPFDTMPELGDIDDPKKYEGEGPEGPLLPSGMPGTPDTLNQSGQGAGNATRGTNGSSKVPSTSAGQVSTPNGRPDSGGRGVRAVVGRKPPSAS